MNDKINFRQLAEKIPDGEPTRITPIYPKSKKEIRYWNYSACI